jgi:hypothetical protein
MDGMMDKRDLIGCAVWLILSVFVLTASLRLGIGALRSPGPGFIPFWASLCLALFACILLGFNLASKTQTTRREEGSIDSTRQNPLIVMALLTGYCLALEKAGYLLATFGLMIALFTLGKMNPWVIMISSLVVSLSSYGLFAYFLGTPLPRGILGF